MSVTVVGCEPVRAPAPYEVWRIHLGGPLPSDARDVLAPEERVRAQRFAFDIHRHRYILAHRALRQVLARRTGVPASALQFGFGPYGKPHLVSPHAAVAFNLSDSDDVALVAMAPEGDIGVDVEMLRAVPDASQLAKAHFTAPERAELAAAPDKSARDRRFLVGWTRKEACLKAIGSGLSIDANTFEAGLEERPRRVAIPVGAETAWVEVLTLPVGPDCVAALARRVEAGPA